MSDVGEVWDTSIFGGVWTIDTHAFVHACHYNSNKLLSCIVIIDYSSCHSPPLIPHLSCQSIREHEMHILLYVLEPAETHHMVVIGCCGHVGTRGSCHRFMLGLHCIGFRGSGETLHNEEISTYSG